MLLEGNNTRPISYVLKTRSTLKIMCRSVNPLREMEKECIFKLPSMARNLEFVHLSHALFFCKNQFISNLLLDSLKFKKLLELQGKR